MARKLVGIPGRHITMTTAATRRAALADAMQTWKNTPDKDEADIAFEAVLLMQGLITMDDIVDSFYWEHHGPNDQGVVITTDTEQIYVDTAGNVSRGAAE